VSGGATLGGARSGREVGAERRRWHCRTGGVEAWYRLWQRCGPSRATAVGELLDVDSEIGAQYGAGTPVVELDVQE
jgi:hypothetical protein